MATTPKKRPPKFDFDAEIEATLNWYEQGLRMQKEWGQWSDHPVAAGMFNSFSIWLKAFQTPANDVFTLWKLEQKAKKKTPNPKSK